jgi:hypothetical protein
VISKQRGEVHRESEIRFQVSFIRYRYRVLLKLFMICSMKLGYYAQSVLDLLYILVYKNHYMILL